MQLTQPVLESAWVRLEPVQERHRAGLRAAAGDMSHFRHMPEPVPRSAGYDALFDWEQGEAAAGRWRRYAVIVRNEMVGHTCYLAIRPEHRGVEIGATWYAPAFQGGATNPAAKLLLLDHAFGCGAERVELKTCSNNARSRAAILKLGASFEGVHRRHMLRADGSWRDTAWYSILRDEWPSLRAGLEARLSQFSSP